jgi:hypothetical protein
MALRASPTAAWLAAGATLLIIGAWLTPAAIAGQQINGWLAGIAGVIAALVFAAAAMRAWPKPERLVPYYSTHRGGTTMEKHQKAVPLVEEGADAERRAHELPEQPQDHIVRGYGAVNPEEGPIQRGER